MTTVSSSLRGRLLGRSLVAALRRLRDNQLSGESSVDDLAAYMHRMRPQFEALAARGPVPRNVILTQIDEGPCAGEWTRLKDTRDADRVTMHVHGGAYTLGSPVTHRGLGRALARVTGGRVWMPEYRLAPEHPYPAALDDVVASYRWLIEDEGVDPARLAVTGDSAGGGLGLALLLRVRDDGQLPLPACYVGMSPWIDLAATGESIRENNGRDAMFGEIDVELAPLLGRLYSGERDVRDPYVSPLYGDLTALPPMLVHVGEAELIRDDGVRLVERAREHGVDASAGVFRDMWHVFQAFPIPEASRSLREIGGFIRRHTDAEYPTTPTRSGRLRRP